MDTMEYWAAKEQADTAVKEADKLRISNCQIPASYHKPIIYYKLNHL